MILWWLASTASLVKSGRLFLSARLLTGKRVVDIRSTVILTQTITEVVTTVAAMTEVVMTEVVVMEVAIVAVTVVGEVID